MIDGVGLKRKRNQDTLAIIHHKIIDEREKVQGKGPLECPSIDENPILKG